MKKMFNNLNLKAMKTKNLHITGSSTLMVLFMGLSLTVFGQTRTNYSRGGTATTTSRAVTATRSSNERTVVTQRTNTDNARTSFRNTQNRTTPVVTSSKPDNKNWNNNSGSKNNSNGWKSNDNHQNGKNNNWNNSYGHNDHGNKNYHSNAWHKGYGHNGYSHNDHGYYHANHHPRTYNAWNFPAPWKYSAHAVVFRHAHDDYFFYNNVFYRYSPYRGYYTVGCPEGIIFTYLPVGYNEVMVNGRIYYRYGNVFFEPVYEGYRVINPPSGLFVTFNF